MDTHHGDPDHHQNLKDCFLSHCRAILKISPKSAHNLLSNVADRQTDRQTNKRTNATENITFLVKAITANSSDDHANKLTFIPILYDVTYF